VKQTKAAWLARSDHLSWSARQIRRELVSRVAMAVDKGMPVIKVLIALCPLMGLLGTVVGMVQVFDTLAITGTGSPGRWPRGSQGDGTDHGGHDCRPFRPVFVNQLDHKAKLAVQKLEDNLKHG
jgi:biopolymer transport protein ExbB